MCQLVISIYKTYIINHIRNNLFITFFIYSLYWSVVGYICSRTVRKLILLLSLILLFYYHFYTFFFIHLLFFFSNYFCLFCCCLLSTFLYIISISFVQVFVQYYCKSVSLTSYTNELYFQQ